MGEDLDIDIICHKIRLMNNRKILALRNAFKVNIANTIMGEDYKDFFGCMC